MSATKHLRSVARYSGTPLLYLAIRLLFKFVLKVFYSSVIVENEHFVPKDGVPCILCANHSNSLTDPLILMTSVPLSKRKWLRMTAKSTLFGRKTFSSWLIESVGSVPIQRAKDNPGAKVDNSAVLNKLKDAIDKQGDMVCFFPEGISQYASYVSPLRSGVARIAVEILQRNRDKPDFELTLLTCSITYLHRDAFRSEVLVSFNTPIVLNVREHCSLFDPANGNVSPEDSVKQLTTLMQEQIRSGTIDAPNFGTVRVANTARRLYAPLGTRMTLSDHVHLTQRFVDIFAKRHINSLAVTPGLGGKLTPATLETPSRIRAGQASKTTATPAKMTTSDGGSSEPGYFDDAHAGTEAVTDQEVEKLADDLHAYQDTLKALWIKDDRVRRPLLPRALLLKRLLVRIAGGLALFTAAFPGFILWLPIFAVAKFYSWRMRTSGRIEDVWDEIAHTKLIYGLSTGSAIWGILTIITFPFSLATLVLYPVLMWVSLRWLEDALSSARAAVALLSMLAVGTKRLRQLQKHREELHERVLRVALERGDLPSDPSVALDRLKRQKEVQERGGKVGRLGYFSVRRRRKKDYNEVMGLWDRTEFPI